MSRFDDRLTKELDRAARPAEPTGVFNEIDRRRERRVRVRRLQTSMLTVVVFAGSIGGVLVLNRAFRGEGVTTPAIAAAKNSPIVVSFGDDGGTHLYLLDPTDPTWDPSDHQLTDPVPNWGGVVHLDTNPSVSPDGRTVAFEREAIFVAGKSTSVWTIGLDGTHERQVTPDSWGAGGPAWSPDGSQLAFVGSPDGHPGLYVADADGTNVRLLAAAGDLVVSSPSWSPDGRTLAFQATLGPDEIYEVGTIGADGTGFLPGLPDTTSDTPTQPSWSPDGSRIAFVRGQDIWTMDPIGGDQMQLTTAEERGSTDKVGADSQPTWSPDGAWIAFERSFSPSEFFVYAIRPDGTDLHRIGVGGDPAWAVARPTPEPSRTVIEPTATLLVSSYGPSGNAALLHGTLAVANGCVGIGSGDTFTYLIWPARSSLVTLDGALSVVDGSGTVGSIGDTIRMGGGIDSLTNAEGAVVGSIPDACRESGEHYWYVGQIEGVDSLASAPSGSKDVIPGLTGKLCNMSSTVADFGRAESGTAYTFERQRGDHSGCLASGHGQAYVAIALEGRRYSASTGPLSPCDPVCGVIGTVDLNADGVDEVLVATRLYYPTSPVIVQVYAVTAPPSGNPYLVAVVGDDGAPLAVSWGSGGGGTWDEGVTCSRTPVPTFTHWRGTSPDAGTTWNWSKTVYSLDVGSDQVVARTISSDQLTTTNPNGPKLHQMCGEDISAG